MSGQLNLDALVTRNYHLEEITARACSITLASNKGLDAVFGRVDDLPKDNFRLQSDSTRPTKTSTGARWAGG